MLAQLLLQIIEALSKSSLLSAMSIIAMIFSYVVYMYFVLCMLTASIHGTWHDKNVACDQLYMYSAGVCMCRVQGRSGFHDA